MTSHFQSTMFTPAVLAEQERYYGRRQQPRSSPAPDALGALEQVFIENRDSFYLATVTETGWPYLQHRGGPRGFLKVLDERALAFADLSGNRQMLSTGNLQQNDRVALFLMDYPRRQRLKILGHATVVPAREDEALVEKTLTAGVDASAVERVYRITVTAFDWNCPKFITPRYTVEEIEKTTAPLKRRIAELESALAQAGGAIPSEPK